jgi:hypothetical protein
MKPYERFSCPQRGYAGGLTTQMRIRGGAVALDEVEALLADPGNTAKLDGAKAMGGDDPMMMMMMVMPVRRALPLRFSVSESDTHKPTVYYALPR